jgi:hypothetical protein
MGIQRIGNSGIFGNSIYFNTGAFINAPMGTTKDIYTVVGRGKLKNLNYSTALGYNALIEIVVDGVVFADNNPGIHYLDSTQNLYKVFHGEVNFRTSLVIRGRNPHNVQTNSILVAGVVELL